MKHKWTVHLQPSSFRPPWLAKLVPMKVGGYRFDFMKHRRPSKSATEFNMHPEPVVNAGDIYAMGTSGLSSVTKSKTFGIYGGDGKGWQWYSTLAELKGGTGGSMLPSFVLTVDYTYTPDSAVTAYDPKAVYQKGIPLASDGYPPYEAHGGGYLRVLAIGEIVESGDYVSSISNRAGMGIIETPTHLIGDPVKEGISLRVLRPIPPTPTPTPKKRKPKSNPVADLADYWLFKYKDACEDAEERAVWERVLETLK